jgi:hypothetical protein
MDLKKIKKAEYNPRKMTKDAREGLKKSMEEFQDISGIVINERTGNVLAGNHRWEQLNKIHGKRNIELAGLGIDGYFMIQAKGQFTGFIARVVDWEEGKEKAANISANNDLIQGEFTQGLQDVLAELNDLGFNEEMFEGLRLDELQIDLSGVDDLEWSEDQLNEIQEQAEEKNRLLDDPNTNMDSEVKEIITQIKISVPSELKDEVKDDILEFLAGKHYYGEINIV